MLLTDVLPRLTMEMLKVDLEFTRRMLADQTISVAMIALVLVCPFQCGDCCGAGHADACVDSSGAYPGDAGFCDCCSGQKPQRPPADGPDDGSNKVDCFCNGAVLSHGTKCPDLAADQGFFAVVVPQSSITRQYSGAGSRGPAPLHASHFPPLASGRDICALVSSYLL